METPKFPRRPWTEALNEAGWTLVADRILHGLAHDLTGQVSSMTGLGYLLEPSDSDSASIMPFFTQELEKMEETVRLLRVLPDDGQGPEPLAPGEVLEDLARLVRAQRGMENTTLKLEGFAGVPAVRIDPTLFNRVVIMALTGSAETAVLRGDPSVLVEGREENGGLVLSIRPGLSREGEGGVDSIKLPSRILPVEKMRSCREVLEEEGVVWEEGGSEAESLQLSFSPPFPS